MHGLVRSTTHPKTQTSSSPSAVIPGRFLTLFFRTAGSEKLRPLHGTNMLQMKLAATYRGPLFALSRKIISRAHLETERIPALVRDRRNLARAVLAIG